MAARVRSSTPPDSPRQPAWATPNTRPASSAITTGRQSATITASTLPGRAVTLASAAGSLRRGGIVGVDDIGAVNLPQPQRLGRQRGAQAPAVLGHSVGIVLGATAEIEGVVRRHADAAGARGAEILTPAHCGPVTTGNPESRVPYDVFLNLRHVGRHGGAEPDLAPAARSSKCSARACSICRPAPATVLPPYSTSASNGWPRLAMCTRIWCVRPVSRRQTTSHTRPPGSTSPRREGK